MSIEKNVNARHAADELMDLGFELAKENEFDAETVRKFWEDVQQAVSELIRKETPKPARQNNAMSHKEAVRFEYRQMPFGKHIGRQVKDVPSSYLAWLADQKDKFKEDLKRYVQSERFLGEYEEEEMEPEEGDRWRDEY